MKKASLKKIPQTQEKKVVSNQKINISSLLSKQDILIVLVVFISYGAALFNGYALDDFIVFVKNHFVQNGISGIGKIFSKDTFAGMTEQNIMVLSGGRYRPLSLVTFAIEHQFSGNSPMLSHAINIIIYALSGIVLFRVLKNVCGQNQTTALITTLVFIALPVHSEAVINVKGRDDLMCFLFFLLSLIQLFNYQRSQKPIFVFWSIIFYFFSLLSKESAITFLILFPLFLYFFSSSSFKKIIITSMPYFFTAIIFIGLRYIATKDNNATVTNTDVFNHPFAFMNAEQHCATIIFTWLLYLKLIFYPLHLSYDYSFNQIPALNFSDWKVWLSIAIHFLMIVTALFYFRRKSIYSFGILFYFVTFSIFSNLFFDIGASMAERFVFVPSLGICLVVINLYINLIEKFFEKISDKQRDYIKYALPLLVVVISSYRNIQRCQDWKDNHSLFISDVKSVPMNAKANLNAGLAYLEMGNLQENSQSEKSFDLAKKYLQRGIEILPTFPDGYLNMGVIYNWELNYDSAEVWWNRARAINPNSSRLPEYDKVLSQHYFQTGMKKGVDKNYKASIDDLVKAYHYDSLNADITYNLGGAYFSINDFTNAKLYWEKSLQINPDNEKAKAGLNAANQRINDYNR